MNSLGKLRFPNMAALWCLPYVCFCSALLLLLPSASFSLLNLFISLPSSSASPILLSILLGPYLPTLALWYMNFRSPAPTKAFKGFKGSQKQLPETEKGKKKAKWKYTGYFIHVDKALETSQQLFDVLSASQLVCIPHLP